VALLAQCLPRGHRPAPANAPLSGVLPFFGAALVPHALGSRVALALRAPRRGNATWAADRQGWIGSFPRWRAASPRLRDREANAAHIGPIATGPIRLPVDGQTMPHW